MEFHRASSLLLGLAQPGGDPLDSYRAILNDAVGFSPPAVNRTREKI
jgi:hypothetical protein